jgi:uncharacterized protein YbjQ (UPF0145 family)
VSSPTDLPKDAESRLAELRHGFFTSDLSVNEFLLVKETGFHPLGFVMGSSIYHTGIQGRRWSKSQELSKLTEAMYNARELAMTRMEEEADELGADGIVGVRLDVNYYEWGSDAAEFIALGTAVKAEDGKSYRNKHGKPFTSDLSGQDFAKLALAGWVPAGLVLGISIGSRHDDWLTVTQTRWTGANSEVHGYTDLVNQTRHDARSQLERDVTRHGADGVVVQEMEVRVRERECPMQEGRRDHIVEATIIGTAIARFAKTARAPAPPLAVISLDPQRRQAARVRLGP